MGQENFFITFYHVIVSTITENIAYCIFIIIVSVFLLCDHYVHKSSKQSHHQRAASLPAKSKPVKNKIPQYHPDLPAGSLCQGSSASSEVEKYFRNFITRQLSANLNQVRIYPPGTGIVTVDTYGKTNRARLRTPDMIIEYKTKKLLVELDPWYTHQDVKVDKMRNEAFAAMNFFVYRIRLGKNSVPISPTDIVIPIDNINIYNPLPKIYKEKIITDIISLLQYKKAEKTR